MASENETPAPGLAETSGNDSQVAQVVRGNATTNNSGENRGRSQPLTPEEEAKRAQQLAEAITAYQAGTLKRSEKPNRSELEAQLQEQEDIILGAQRRIDEIKSSLNNRREGSKSARDDTQNLRKKLWSIRAQFQTALEEKQHIRSEINAIDAAKDLRRSQIKDLKSKMSFVTVEQIDEEIRKLEYNQSHSSHSLQEEKKIVSQIQELKKSRTHVSEFQEKSEALADGDALRKDLMDRMKAKDAVLNELKEQEAEQRRQIDESRSKEDEDYKDRAPLMEERSALYQTITEAREKKAAIRSEFRKRENDYYLAEKAFRELDKDRRKKDYEARKAEREARELEKKIRDLENNPPPYDIECTDCDQLIMYIEKLVGVKDNKAGGQLTDEEKFKAAQAAIQDDEKLVVKRRDNPEELDSWWGGLGGKDKKKKGKRGGGGGGDSSGGDSDGKPGKLMHVMEIMSSFSLVGVDVPTHRKDCPGCLEALREKKAYFEELRKKAAAKKDEIVEAARKGEDVSEQIKELYKNNSSSKSKGKDEGSKKSLKAPIDALKAPEEFPAMNGSGSEAPRQGTDGSYRSSAWKDLSKAENTAASSSSAAAEGQKVEVDDEISINAE